MRRKDRQVTNMDEIVSIIGKCEVCRLGLVDGGKPYVVPMNFGFEVQGTSLTLYFHCAKEGRKIDILRADPSVCFEMDCGHALVEGTNACNYGYRYESVIGNGKAEIVEEYDEKVRSLNKIMEKYAGTGDFSFSPNETASVTIIKIQTDDYTAKRNG